jgi:hypothetical protein
MTKRTIEEINAIRVPLGFPERKKAVSKSKPRPAILPESKKAQAQAVLAKMLGKKGRDVVNKILAKALDDKDEDQMACLKLVADRIIPASYFDLDKTKNKSSGVTIQILGVGETTINSSPNEEEDEYIEGELVDE